MSRYKLSVDETRNSLKHIEIETSLTEIELDALLDKIEKDNEIVNSEELVKKLEAQSVKVTGVIEGAKNYYTKAETLEIEALED
ncbi:hypothetical protein [Clostridium beijerinckii]|uniref:Uncharacterized protein n=1 Tax=Clostridium beijerinckii TaxID=1520 RepID=A0AAX0AZA6_CLOBE|nr:hypothetical protein [Clostridium beijerinckii]NRT88136.1 hypothetical protein [Clostridium beijerinckii]NYC73564.1 hypothetical protein [Clostridium beijerinckii]